MYSSTPLTVFLRANSNTGFGTGWSVFFTILEGTLKFGTLLSGLQNDPDHGALACGAGSRPPGSRECACLLGKGGQLPCWSRLKAGGGTSLPVSVGKEQVSRASLVFAASLYFNTVFKNLLSAFSLLWK